MELSLAQKRCFLEDGYLHVPGVVPRTMVDAALRTINRSLGQGMNVADMPTFRAQSYCPESRKLPIFLDLVMKTDAWPILEVLLGVGQVKVMHSSQIALRFPAVDETRRTYGAHIDGVSTPHNGVPPGTLSSFTALAGILLSDLPEPNAGNFTVWPGTHRQHAEYFRKHGPEELLKGPPPVALPEPRQIMGRAGDLVIAHYLLAHGVAPHQGPNIRYACFFRIQHVRHETEKWDSIKDEWLHYPGIRELAK